MVKKINKDAVTIKELLGKGLRQCEIARLLKLKKEKVSYWARTEIKDSQKKSKKLKDIYIDRIKRWAKNQVTSKRSSRKIASMINSVLMKRKELDSKGRQISIHFTTVNNYLKEYFGKPRKIRKVFFLSKENMKKRKEFCQMILDKKIQPEQLFFTDESKIDLGSYTNDLIRLDPEKQKWDKHTYKLLNRPKKKFESSLIIAGGINYFGLSKLIFLEGTMNQFSYGQTLLFYKDDIKKIEEKEKIKIILEQDGASSHTSKSNKFILDKLFSKEGWIQNPPNSPDLAYPIEQLWAIIKARVKRRAPKTIEKLKKYLLEEWNAIPPEIVKNLCRGYLKRVQKVLELEGGRIEPEHLKKEKSDKKDDYIWEIPEVLPNQRIAYNDENLVKHREKEIKFLKNFLKEKKSKLTKKIRSIGKKIKSFKKRELKNLSIGRGIAILRKREELIYDKATSIEEKQKCLDDLTAKISEIKKMNVFEYLRHINGDDESDSKSNSTSAEIEDKIDSFEELIKNNEEIKYKNIRFHNKEEELKEKILKLD